MSIELNCRTCGNNRFEFPESDHEQVLCQFCGDSVGTYAQVKARIAEEVTKRSTQPLGAPPSG